MRSVSDGRAKRTSRAARAAACARAAARGSGQRSGCGSTRRRVAEDCAERSAAERGTSAKLRYSRGRSGGCTWTRRVRLVRKEGREWPAGAPSARHPAARRQRGAAGGATCARLPYIPNGAPHPASPPGARADASPTPAFHRRDVNLRPAGLCTAARGRRQRSRRLARAARRVHRARGAGARGAAMRRRCRA